MPVDKQIIDVPFVGGVDTKTDPKRVIPAKLITLENGVFTAPGEIIKRNGFLTASTNSILGGGTVSGVNMLTTRANELVQADGQNLYSWDVANSAWSSRGIMRSITATSQPFALNQYSIAGYDVAIGSLAAGNLYLAVYEQWTKFGGTYIGIGYVAVDVTSGAVVASGTISGGGGTATSCICPKVLFANGNFIVFYINSTDTTIRQALIAGTAPQTVASDAAITSGATTSNALCSFGAITKKRYDVCLGGTNIYLVFNNDVGGGPSTNGTTIFRMTQAAPATVASSAVRAATDSAVVCVFYDSSTQSGQGAGPVLGYLTSFVANQTAAYAMYNSGLTSLVSSGTIEATGLIGFSTITGINVGGSSTILYRFFYGLEASNAGGKLDNSYIRSNTVTTGGFTVGTPATMIRSVLPVSKPFLQSDGINTSSYLPVTFDTSNRSSWDSTSSLSGRVFQTTYFVIGADTPYGGAVVARVFPGTAGGVYNNSTSQTGIQRMLPETINPTGSQWLFPALNAYRLQSTSSATTFETELVGVTLNFADTIAGNSAGALPAGFSRAVLANTLHVGSAALQMYDGGAVVEHGFHFYPYALSNSTAGGGSIGAGTNSYCACYEWTDAYGQIHRSAPSVAISVTCGATSTNTITCPTLRLTSKTSTRPVRVVFYRTQNAGTVFYQLGTTTNDTTVDTITYADAAADATIAGSTQLYTTGNVLQNGPAAPLVGLTTYRNRLVGIDSTNKLSLWRSKQVVLGAPVEFSGFLAFNVDPRGGDCTALAQLDDKLIIFKDALIFVTGGQGPDSTGGQDDWPDAQLISSEVGCIAPLSIAVTDVGVFFQSRKGIFLLDRSLQTHYIGADVEGLINILQGTPSNYVNATALMPNSTQIRFVLTGGTNAGSILVYDTRVQQWSHFPSLNAISGTVWNGVFHFANNSSNTLKLDALGTYSDQGSTITLKIVTAWLSFAQVQGFQRIWRWLLLGEYAIQAPNISLSVGYDFSTSTTALPVMTPSATPFQFRYSAPVQKCEAIQITITDSTSTAGGVLKLSGLLFEAGIKRGAYRLPASSSTG